MVIVQGLPEQGCLHYLFRIDLDLDLHLVAASAAAAAQPSRRGGSGGGEKWRKGDG